MRNIVAHDYGNVDLKIVWDVATLHVPGVCAVLERFFGNAADNAADKEENASPD